MNEFIKSTALWPSEQFINSVIQSDPHIKKKISPLSGKLIHLEVKSPDLFFSIKINKDFVNIDSVNLERKDLAPDIVVSGKLEDLISLLHNKGSLADGNISIKGDIQFAQELNEALHTLDLNWSDILAPKLGHAATGEIERFITTTKRWSLQFHQSLKQNLEDYLKEEKKVVPTNDDVKEFFDSIDQLKFKIDRIKSKADLLDSGLKDLDN